MFWLLNTVTRKCTELAALGLQLIAELSKVVTGDVSICIRMLSVCDVYAADIHALGQLFISAHASGDSLHHHTCFCSQGTHMDMESVCVCGCVNTGT